jgi:hypothetical protein
MSGTSRDPESEQLEIFWNSLRADLASEPPASLDPASAALVRELQRELTPPEPDAGFVRLLRDRLHGDHGPTDASRVAQALPPNPRGFRPANPDQPASPANTIRRRKIVREVLKMVAAIVSIVVVGTMLVLLFRDDPNRAPAGQGASPPASPTTDATASAIASPASDTPKPTVTTSVGLSEEPPPPSESPAAPAGELLVSLRTDGGDQQLAVVAADSSYQRLLIPEGAPAGQQWEGVWSPDGSQVAFTVTNGSSSDIYVVNADGSNLRRLTPQPAWTPNDNQYLTQTEPAWSPDGTRIAFSSNLEDGYANFDIYVINADGSNLQRLRDDTLSDWSPRWSPDGSMIAYEVHGDGANHYGNVYVMNADGTNRRRLVDTIAAGDPNWSPNGEWIAYSDGRFGRAVHIVRVDGTDRRDLAGVGMMADSPRWSPDGTLLAWSAHEGGGSLDGVFLHNLRTGETQHISNMAGRLEWSPEGIWIAVAYQKVDTSGNQIGQSGVYFVRADGQNEEPLIDLPIAGDVTIDWWIGRR